VKVYSEQRENLPTGTASLTQSLHRDMSVHTLNYTVCMHGIRLKAQDWISNAPHLDICFLKYGKTYPKCCKIIFGGETARNYCFALCFSVFYEFLIFKI
jgi:hypothetical protein